MTAFNRILNWVGLENEYEEENEEVEYLYEEKPQQIKRERGSKVVNISQGTQMDVVVNRLQNFDDAKSVVDSLKNRRPVVINLEILDETSARRAVDFVSGAVYGLNGHIQKVAEGIFLITPSHVGIAGDFRDEYKNSSGIRWDY